MRPSKALNRRNMVKGSLVGLLTPFAFSKLNSGINFISTSNEDYYDPPSGHYPNIDPALFEEVVGKSHFNLERVKELVDERPELSRSSWEWRYGDIESAIGAASHVGRRDIALYLIEKGARPNIYSFAMLGAYQVVKSMIEFSPGIQTFGGAHGISLLAHANAGMRMKDKMTGAEIDNLKKLIDYLESLGDADGPSYEKLSEKEQQKYLGIYKYGEKENEGFSISINMLKTLSLGPINGFGGGLLKIEGQTFTYNGAPSVRVVFEVVEDKVLSLTVNEPNYSLKAVKVS